MQALAEFLIRSVSLHPDEAQLTAVEGSSSLLLELRAHPDDVQRFRAERSQLIRAMQVVLNAASGPRKTVLDLVDGYGGGEDEE